jgi:hypothetical protein
MSHLKHMAPLLRLGEGIARRRKYFLVTFGKAPKEHVVPLGSVLRVLGLATKEIRNLLVNFKVFCNYRIDGSPRYVKTMNFPVVPGDRVGVDKALYAVSVDTKGGLSLEQTDDAVVRLKILRRIRTKSNKVTLICTKGYVFHTEAPGNFVELSPSGIRLIESIGLRPCCIQRKFLKAPVITDGLEPSYIL